MKKKNYQLLHNLAGMILRVEVIDGSGNRKLFKDSCNILNEKELARIFSILQIKFNINIPKALKKEVSGWMLG